MADAPPLSRRYITISEAAEYLAVTDRTVRQMIADGRLRGYRSGTRLVRLRRDEVDGAMHPFGGAGGSPPTRRCPATEDRAPATVATPSSTDPTASRAVSWWSVHEYVAPTLAAAVEWPMAGTPAWCDLDDTDPVKWAAICDAARHWALRVETCQAASAEASRDVSAAADWPAVSREIQRRRDAYIRRVVV